jgi:hypothetical protein
MDRKIDRHKSEIATIHRSRERLGRVDSGETTVEKREDVKNSVLPRWRSAAIRHRLVIGGLGKGLKEKTRQFHIHEMSCIVTHF